MAYRIHSDVVESADGPSRVLSVRLEYAIWRLVQEAVDEQYLYDETVQEFLWWAVLNRLIECGLLEEVEDDENNRVDESEADRT